MTKHYRMGGSMVRALDGVDLDVREGEFIAIIGPSGSGKSTLMHILGLLDRPSGGRMELDGVEVGSISRARQAGMRAEKLGFVFQSFNLLAKLTVLQNVLLPTYYLDRPGPRRELEGRALGLLERVGLGERARHRPAELSGGQRQRVAIARALMNRPRLILADEPTGNLDSEATGQIMELFGELSAEGRTIAFVTHDLGLVRHATRVVRVRDGRVAEEE